MSGKKGTFPAATAVRVGFISLGCAKNSVDSQVMAGCILNAGMQLSAPDDADVLLINTCAFIQEARDEAAGHIEEACRLKQAGKCRAVIVAGCLPQRYRDKIKDVFPAVDAFIGLDEIDRIDRIILRALNSETQILSIAPQARRLFDYGESAVVFSAGPYAYLKLAEGCNHKCAFCAIPAIRGKRRSRPVKQIVAEAEKLLERGFPELNLIAQDITAYGQDLAGKTLLPELLRELGRIGGKFWIRLLYAYPNGITQELLEVMAATPQVCRYLDVPVQHSHPTVLRAMRRSETIKAVTALPEKIRSVMPDATLRTTCLLGHPGETNSHFLHLLRYLDKSRFDHVGAFVFSPEEGTPAAKMHPRPRLSTAEMRRDALLELQYERICSTAQQRVGTTDEILLEAPQTKRFWRGRSRGLAPEIDGTVLVSGVPRNTKPGTFIPVRYTAVKNYDMISAFCP